MTRDIAIKCPVCLGRCQDERGQECKPCSGKGILWGKETDDAPAAAPFVPMPYPVPQPSPMMPWPWGGYIWSSASTSHIDVPGMGSITVPATACTAVQ